MQIMNIITNAGSWVKMTFANLLTPIVGSSNDAMMLGEVFKWIFYIALILVVITVCKKVYRMIAKK